MKLPTPLIGLIAAAVLALASGPAVSAPDFVIESMDLDFQGEIEAAADEGKHVAIFFHQLGCPYCDKMRTRVFTDPKVQKFFNDNFVVIETNIKGSLPVVSPEGEELTEKTFARKIRVRATPVMTFYGKDAALGLRTTGYLDPARFMKAGEYVVNGVYKDGTSFFRFLRDSAKK